MLRLSQATCTLCCAALLLLPAGRAQADVWDLQLNRLCQIYTSNDMVLDCGGGYNKATHGDVVQVLPDNPAFRSLMSELGAVFSPNILAASDTQGYGGFSFRVEFGWTMINPKKNSADYTTTVEDKSKTPDPSGRKEITTRGHRFWRAAGAVNSKHFSLGNIRNNQDSAIAAKINDLEKDLPTSFAPTVTILARKGIWFPGPSFEIGLGVRHLIGSQMWMPLAQVKLALHEGFQNLPIPAIAIRASGGRVMGTPDFNLNVVGLDGSLSKHFGVASSFNLTPYLGYQANWIIADAEVMDSTPGVDPMQESTGPTGTYNGKPKDTIQCRHPDCRANFSFADQADITRHRIFFGLKANFYIATLTLEYTYFFAGTTSDEVNRRTPLGTLIGETIEDSAGAQHSINVSVGFDY